MGHLEPAEPRRRWRGISDKLSDQLTGVVFGHITHMSSPVEFPDYSIE